MEESPNPSAVNVATGSVFPRAFSAGTETEEKKRPFLPPFSKPPPGAVRGVLFRIDVSAGKHSPVAGGGDGMTAEKKFSEISRIPETGIQGDFLNGRAG